MVIICSTAGCCASSHSSRAQSRLSQLLCAIVACYDGNTYEATGKGVHAAAQAGPQLSIQPRRRGWPDEDMRPRAAGSPEGRPTGTVCGLRGQAWEYTDTRPMAATPPFSGAGWSGTGMTMGFWGDRKGGLFSTYTWWEKSPLNGNWVTVEDDKRKRQQRTSNFHHQSKYELRGGRMRPSKQRLCSLEYYCTGISIESSPKSNHLALSQI
ncbi:hypothetical protein F4780DRAFT_482959 [Xylariomycetidae sp. FL0641]|nr:hypothetical protein F4780DRAFT_482959 [Xylariomycetidae sp. FL0641]